MNNLYSINNNSFTTINNLINKRDFSSAENLLNSYIDKNADYHYQIGRASCRERV